MRFFKWVLRGTTGFLAVIATLWTIIPTSANSVESIYSRTIFPIIAWLVIRISDLIPFSLAGTTLIIAPITIIFLITRAIQQKRFNLAWLWRTPLVIIAIYGLFILIWGANYRRDPIETTLQLEPTKITNQDLEMLAQNLLITMQQEANAPRDRAQAFSALRNSISQTIKAMTGTTPTLPTQIKTTPAGLLMVLQTSGVVSPITLEAHVDGGLPEPFFLAVSAHELVHTTGFAGEADTDLIAAIAGLRSSHAYARYCIALTYFAKVLGDTPEALRTKLIKQLPSTAKTDYAALRTAQEKYWVPWLASVSQVTYNQYLKSQGVKAGIQDYSRITVLLAAAQAKGLIFR